MVMISSLKKKATLFVQAALPSIQAIAQSLMHVLPPGMPLPEIKVVNSPASRWLGICRFNYMDDTSRIELQKTIVDDETTLKRIIAHELCHHAEFLEAKAWGLSKGWDGRTFSRMYDLTHSSHGDKFQKWADAFNAAYGPGFVTKTSDEAMVKSETTSPIYVLLWQPEGKTLRWSYAQRPSPKQKEFIKEKLLRSDHKYVVTRDSDFAQGVPIGKGMGSTNQEALNTKLQQLWDSAPEAKVASMEEGQASYPLAPAMVDGLQIGSKIPNMGSIEASLSDYTILKGVRVVPMSAVNGDPKALFYAKNDQDRARALAEKIRENGYIDPLIVVLDSEGPYILEGAHRLGALFLLGKGAFPALVVQDNEEP